MDRPKVTDELIAVTAFVFGTEIGWDEDQIADLARVYRHTNMDGYELAKELERVCSWCPTASDVETLDEFPWAVRERHSELCKAWATENNIQPPLPIGTMTTRGEITGVSEHDAAMYLVRQHGETDESRRLLIKFEDARAVEPLAVGAA